MSVPVADAVGAPTVIRLEFRRAQKRQTASSLQYEDLILGLEPVRQNLQTLPADATLQFGRLFHRNEPNFKTFHFKCYH